MGNQTAKQGRNSQPIVRHPLFPAIVALWFAALFGLGSMALRASLLESLVIASKIDLFLPQAAPPLGITARILVAAVMAIIGGLAGMAIARRIARPKPEVRERRRGAAPVETSRPISRYAAPDPMPEAEDTDDEQSAIANRRGGLVVAEDRNPPFTIHEAAPLPGGQPQILDVTEFKVAGLGEANADAAADFEAASAPAGDAALDLATFAEDRSPVTHEFENAGPAQAPAQFAPQEAPVQVLETAIQPEQTALARSFDAPVEPSRAFDAPPVQSFQAQVEPAIQAQVPEAFEPADSAPVSFARPFEAPQTDTPAPVRAFDAPEPASPAVGQLPPDAPAQEFGPEEEPMAAQQAFARPAAELPVAPEAAPTPLARFESQTVFGQAETDEADADRATSDEPGDDDPMAALRNRRAPLPVIDVEPEFDAAPAPDYSVNPEMPADTMQPLAETAPVPAETQSFAPQAGTAAQRLTEADLAELSPVELIERLALTLQRRRQPAVVETQAAPAVQPQAEPATWQPVFSAPSPQADEIAETCEQPEAETALSRLTLPAALRPIDFAEYEKDEHQPVFVPGRSITMPQPPETEMDAATGSMPDYFALAQQGDTAVEAQMPVEVSETPADAPEPVVDNGPDESEDDVLAAGYSSLLDMTKPVEQRQHFVRIEDPEAETEAAEPVVIFPGQGKRAGTQFAAPSQGPLATPSTPLPSMADSDGPVRRFDAPAQPAAARDPDETERALRSALATLQRMSGAA